MKQALYIFIGLLVISNVSSAVSPVAATSSTSSTSSGTLTLNPSSCQMSRTTQVDSFSCPCAGGSGSYNWVFSQLPQGWTVNNNVISAPSGSMKDNLLYGCKVQVSDKNTKQNISKSLFFYLKNGKISSVVDYPYSFQANYLIPSAGNFIPTGKTNTFTTTYTIPSFTSTSTYGVSNTNINNIKNLFSSVNGIGGGCGLVTLTPYFLGSGGLYSNDSSNPYLNQLPTSAQVTSVLSSGNSSSITNLLVYVVRSKVQCKSVATFLNNFLQQIRTKISDLSNQVVTSSQLVSSIQIQILSLQKSAPPTTTTTTITSIPSAQLTNLQNTITSNKNIQTSLQSKLNILSQNITAYQNQITNLITQQKQYQSNDQNYNDKINSYNTQINSLQAQIQNLTNLVNQMKNSKSQNSDKLNNLQNQINVINGNINTINKQISQINSQIQNAKNAIASAQSQINTIQSSTPTTTTVTSTPNIQSQLTQLQQNLTIANANYLKAQSSYNDLSTNYNMYIYIANSNLNGCYGTLYNDQTSNLFSQDDNGKMKFSGKDRLANYIVKVFGKSASTLTPNNLLFSTYGTTASPCKNGGGISSSSITISSSSSSYSSSSSFSSSSSSSSSGGVCANNGGLASSGAISGGGIGAISGGGIGTISGGGIGTNLGGGISAISGGGQVGADLGNIVVSQLNILSPQWIVAFGNPFNNPTAPNSQTFTKNDFTVPLPGTSGQNSFKGTIKSIQGYTCQAVDSQNIPYTLYFGGGTDIQLVNKQLPQIGDTIYWLGTIKPGGKSTDYNVNQCICY